MNKLTLATLLLATGLSGACISSYGQQDGNTPIDLKDGFKRIHAVEYKIYKDAPGKNCQPGDVVEFNILLKCDTATLGDSRQQPGGKPASMPVMETKNPTDWQLIIPYLSAGDSAVLRVPCDSIIATIPKDNKQPLPPWLKSGNFIMIYLDIVAVKDKNQVAAERSKMEEQEKVAAGRLVIEDDKTLKAYFAKNKLKPTKTASGLYYTIKKQGTGAAIKKNSKVSMNYTGKLLDGTPFDSNIDSNFHHVTPLEFNAGMGNVIKGWDEGVMLLKKGSKATFYIPSGLAYGSHGAGGIIGPNAILTFDVEVVKVEEPK